MIERYLNFLGLEETQKLLEANEKPLIPTIRVNTLKIKTNELKEKLEKKGFILEPVEWVSEAFKVVKKTKNIGSTHEYLQGYYYLQNVASMIPAQILNPQPNETVIDMCASPGSKSTHLAQIMNNKGKLILIEKNKRRIPALELNVRRLGVSNTLVLNQDAVDIGDLKIKAEKILLDAPCTGEGLIRQDSTRKSSRNRDDLIKLSKIQKRLLYSGLRALNPGGHLLYSTCSIAPEENEIVITDTLKNNPNYEIIPIKQKYGVPGLTSLSGIKLNQKLSLAQRLYPHIHNTIGFFLCLIRKLKP